MKKAMFQKLISLGSWNLIKVPLLFQEQELCIREEVKLITSGFIDSSLSGCLLIWLKDLLLVGKSVASLGACTGCPPYTTLDLF